MQAASYWQQWAVVHGMLNEQQQPAEPATAATSDVCWQQPLLGI
jgi:hypothetical protein